MKGMKTNDDVSIDIGNGDTVVNFSKVPEALHRMLLVTIVSVLASGKEDAFKSMVERFGALGYDGFISNPSTTPLPSANSSPSSRTPASSSRMTIVTFLKDPEEKEDNKIRTVVAFR